MGRGAEHEAKDWTWAVGQSKGRRAEHRTKGKTRIDARADIVYAFVR